MTVGEKFSMSSATYCIRYLRLFAVYFFKKCLTHIFYCEIILLYNCHIKNVISLFSIKQLKNFSPTVMFRGTPCIFLEF